MEANKTKSVKGLSFFNYLQAELRRGYLLENDEQRYAARREKVYTFFKIPREIEKFLAYGFFQSADSFLFVLTFLPIRFTLALCCLIFRSFKNIFRLGKYTKLLKPAEIVDLLKGALLIICCYAISYIDTSMCYHIIKTQSTIKLYLFFNMLEIADRLMSAFGQDTLDALFWTATEPRDRKREHFGVLFHLIVASIYVFIHSTIVLLQALTLNVAINSDNKGLLTIVISNNFVELKGAVFKKFDRNNLLQISCSDVRERFHICTLLFVVVIQTLKEYAWKEERFWILLPDCLFVMGTEVMIDWLKHAFITRFNDIPIDVYRDYRLLIASDLIMCKQKFAYSDHSDLVARRMGFIPLPLGVVIYRILSQSLSLTNFTAYLSLAIGFLCLISFRVLNGIVILGKACDLINSAELQQRSRNVSECWENIRSRNASEMSIDTKSPAKTTNSLNGSTPIQTRKKNISNELTDSVTLTVTQNMVENIGTPASKYSTNQSTENKDCDISVKTCISNEPIINRICRRSISSDAALIQLEVHDIAEDNDSKSLEEVSNINDPPLGFLGESQFGLMANSMVNLASVGINQGVTDHDSSETITQDMSTEQNIQTSVCNSPDYDSKDSFSFKDISTPNEDIADSKIYSSTPNPNISLTSSQSFNDFDVQEKTSFNDNCKEDSFTGHYKNDLGEKYELDFLNDSSDLSSNDITLTSDSSSHNITSDNSIIDAPNTSNISS